MKIHKIPYSKVLLFANRDVKYILEDPALRPFFKYPASIEAFKEAIEDKSKEKTDRITLVEVLITQHSKLELNKAVSENTIVFKRWIHFQNGIKYFFWIGFIEFVESIFFNFVN